MSSPAFPEPAFMADEELRMFADSVGKFLDRNAPPERVAKWREEGMVERAFWREAGEAGLLGVSVPEAFGGHGGDFRHDVVVAETIIRKGVEGFAAGLHNVIITPYIQAHGTEGQKKKWLPKLVSGEAIVTPAWMEPQSGFGPKGVNLRATKSGDGFVLSGQKRHVAFASSAARLVVLARTGEKLEDISLFLVDPHAEGVSMKQLKSLASDTQYDVRFDGVRVPAAARIGAANGGWTVWDAAMHDGIVVLAGLAMGGCERALEITVQYAKDRKQFDKPIGAFQAISHYLADAVTQLDGGKTLVYEAAAARAAGRDIRRLAPMAKLFACQTYRDATAMCQQVWGGVGFTIEYDIQLYFRRAKQLQLTWWDTRHLEELIAADVLDR